MPAEFEMVFDRLKQILKKYSGQFTIKPDSDSKYGLYAKVGPATLKAWKGKMKSDASERASRQQGKNAVRSGKFRPSRLVRPPTSAN